MRWTFAAALLLMAASASADDRTLGIRIKPVLSAQRDIAKLGAKMPVTAGLFVERVGEKTPDGIVEGDIITAIDERRISSISGINSWLDAADIDKAYQFTVYRLGDTGYAKLVVAVVVSRKRQVPAADTALPPDKAKDGGKPRSPFPPPVIARLGPGDVRADSMFKDIYIPKGGRSFVWRPFVLRYREGGKEHLEVEGFFNPGGKPARIKYGVEDESMASVSVKPELGAIYEFKKPGAVTLTATIADMQLAIPFRCIELPVALESPSADAVELLGFPDSRNPVFVEWPESETIDGIFYSPDARQGSISAENWRYSKFPGAVLSIDGGKVARIGNDLEHTHEDFMAWSDELGAWIKGK